MKYCLLLKLLLLLTGLPAQDEYLITSYGARNDSAVLSTTPFKQPWTRPARPAGEPVIIPRDNFLSGTLRLYSHTTLHLRAGDRLLASRDNKAYITPEPIFKAYPEEPPMRSTPVLIYANGATHVSITGQGTINGRARRT